MIKFTQEVSGASSCPTLSLKKQNELIRKAKEGNESAKIKLFNSLKQLIIQDFCVEYGIPAFLWQDVINEAYIGFEKALRDFDEKRGVKFSTYTFYKIKEVVFEWLRKEATIKLPVKKTRLLAKLEAYLDTVPVDVGYPWRVDANTVQNFCRATKQNPSVVESLIRSRRIFNVESLTLVKNSINLSASTVLPPQYLHEKPVERKVYYDLKKEALAHAIKEVLDPKERIVIQLRYGMNGHKPHTLKDVRSKINVTSRERVRQIQDQGLGKIRIFLLINYPQFCYAN